MDIFHPDLAPPVSQQQLTTNVQFLLTKRDFKEIVSRPCLLRTRGAIYHIHCILYIGGHFLLALPDGLK